jgi:hypothetical protein
MAITVSCADPARLLAVIRSSISEGKIDTWRYDSDGDFTHTPPQWVNQAWLRPSIGFGQITFGIIGNKNIKMTKSVYGVYHGRFTEMLLMHFDTDLQSIRATAQQQAGVDNFT